MARQKNLHTTAQKIIETCAGWNSRLAARRISQFIDREMAETGLSLAQFALMGQIAAASDDTLSALAQRCDLDLSTLSRNLRQLEKEELVEIVTIENDLRRRAVWLTEKGARTLEAAVPAWARAQAKLAKFSLPDLARRLAVETETLAADEDTSSQR
jgi:DNA-binding MarR family transcriptional regulator